jgi:hypothetical protein
VRRAAGAVAVALGLWLSLFAPVASAAGAPQVGPAWTGGVGSVTATLLAEVSPNGLSGTYHFDYLPEATYQANLGAGKDGFAGAAKAPPGSDPSIGSGVVAATVSRSISSLQPDTAYRYRVQATNSAGTTFGLARPFRTEPFGGGPILLDGRGWELVSPVEKDGGEVQGPGQSFGGGTIQAAAGGSALTYSSTSAFGDAGGAPAGSQYVSRRAAGGWATENVTEPTVSGAYGEEPDGVPFQLFSVDLAQALMLDGRCREAGAGDPCPRSYLLRESATGALATSPARPDLWLAGANADLSQRVLSTCAALTANAVEVPGPDGCDPAKPNLYRWSAGGLSLVNLLPAAVVGTPGADLAAQAGATSSDGSRVYWRELASGNLFLREAASTKQVDDTVGGGGTFQAASTSGALAYFTSSGHLYRYDAPSDTATDLTPAGGVVGVLGASADGARVYYLSAAGLFLRQGATTTKVADAADASNYPPATGTARVTPSGSHLAFLSSASLTGYDNRKRATPPGPPQVEAFLYDAGTGVLTCASCNPSGEQPLGGSTIPGALANGKGLLAIHAYKPRALSDDGRRLFFDSLDELALQDEEPNHTTEPDVYEWEAQGAGSCAHEGGCVGLVSSGDQGTGSAFLDASATGGDAFFLTSESLVGADTGFADLYDARVGGGFPEPARPIECFGDSCQFLPSEPEDPNPGTLIPSTGNPPLRFPRLPGCRKGFVRKHGKCVRKQKAKRGARKRGGAGRKAGR